MSESEQKFTVYRCNTQASGNSYPEDVCCLKLTALLSGNNYVVGCRPTLNFLFALTVYRPNVLYIRHTENRRLRI